ncbi:MAG: transglutaminase family protein, partial [Acetanaerobacterium sp.]
YDVNDLLSFHFGRSVSSHGFELAWFGFQPLSDRLGGPISPGDATLLSVDADRSLLLRGAVEDTYSGKGWYDGYPGGRFRYNSLMFLSTRGHVLSAELPLTGNRALEGLSAQITHSAEIEVKYLNGRSTGVFVAGRVTDLDTDQNIEPYFNLQSELFTKNSVSKNVTYTFTAEMLDRDTAGFDQSMLRLEPEALAHNDPNWGDISGQYLSLPDSLPDSVRRAADEITAGAASPYQKAAAIEQWLAQQCTYTLSPDVPPVGEDFVAHFLQTKEGYCVYYASAMAVLARCAGLPSRYVTGFALENTTVPQHFVATERSAHAWAEVYLYGIGWVTFDPLGYSGGLEPPETELQTAPPGYAPDGYSSNESPVPSDGATLPQPPDAGRVWLWLLALAVLTAVVWISLKGLQTAPVRYYRYDRVAARREDEGQRLCVYYEDLLRQIDFFELSPYIGETLREFAPRVDRRLRLDDSRFVQITQWYMDVLYGMKQPDKSAVKNAAGLHAVIEERLAVRLGRAGYLLKRALPVWGRALSRKNDR